MSAPDEPGKVSWGYTLGDAFSRTVTFGWDMTGWTARLQLRLSSSDASPAASPTCTVTPGASSSTVAVALAPGVLTEKGTFRGDLELTPPSSGPETWLLVTLNVREDWTR